MAVAQATVESSVAGNRASVMEEYLSAIRNTTPLVRHWSLS